MGDEMRWVFQLCAAGLLLLSPPAVIAQQVDMSEEAKKLFIRGREATKHGDCQSAIPLFQESYKLSPKPGTLLNLAECEEKLGMIADAASHFQELLTQLPPTDSRLIIAREGISRMAPRIPKLRISVAASAPAELTITLDGKKIEASPKSAEVPVNPGNHIVEVTAPQKPKRVYEVNLAEGATETLILETASAPPPTSTSELARPEVPPASVPQAALAPPRPSSPSAAAPGPRREALDGAPSGWGSTRTATLVAGGVGFAGLGLGSIMGALVIAKKNELETLCPVPKQCTQEGVNLESSARTFAGVSTGAFIVGLASVGVAAVLLIVEQGEGKKPQVTSLLSPVGSDIRGTF